MLSGKIPAWASTSCPRQLLSCPLSGLCHCPHSVARLPGTQPLSQSPPWEQGVYCSVPGPWGSSQPGGKRSRRGAGLGGSGPRAVTDVGECGRGRFLLAGELSTPELTSESPLGGRI